MIELKDYELVLNKSLYASFTVYIKKFDIEIAQCKEFRMSGEKGPRRWFAFPSYRKETVDGFKFFPIVKFSLPSTEEKLWEEVRKLVNAHLLEHPELDRQPEDFNSTQELPF